MIFFDLPTTARHFLDLKHDDDDVEKAKSRTEDLGQDVLTPRQGVKPLFELSVRGKFGGIV